MNLRNEDEVAATRFEFDKSSTHIVISSPEPEDITDLPYMGSSSPDTPQAVAGMHEDMLELELEMPTIPLKKKTRSGRLSTTKSLHFCKKSYQYIMQENKRLRAKSKCLKQKIQKLRQAWKNNNPMNTLLEAIEIDTLPKQSTATQIEDIMWEVEDIVNDIFINTHAFIQLKPYFPRWRHQVELFDLGIINKESH
jgi:hypothetical protein